MTKATRRYSEKTIKLLFGSCGNQCAAPDCTNPIVAAGTLDSDAAVVGQICHIYAASDDGPRGKQGLTAEERDAPENLILMCGFHHPLVDKQWETYPADVLKTFVFYKPKRIVTSVTRSMMFNFAGDPSRARDPAGPRLIPYPPLAIGLLFVSLAVALVHFGIGAVSTAELSRIVGVTLLLAAFALPTYFAVWAKPPTAADLLLYCLFGLGLAAGAMLVVARSALPLYVHGARVPVAEKKR